MVFAALDRVYVSGFADVALDLFLGSVGPDQGGEAEYADCGAGPPHDEIGEGEGVAEWLPRDPADEVGNRQIGGYVSDLGYPPEQAPQGETGKKEDQR